MSLDEFHLFPTYSYLFGNKRVKSKLSISRVFLMRFYDVPDVVLLFRQLRGWFELRVLSMFIVGGPCRFLGILGMLNGISFDYTDRTSTLPSSATVTTPTLVSIILISSLFSFATGPYCSSYFA